MPRCAGRSALLTGNRFFHGHHPVDDAVEDTLVRQSEVAVIGLTCQGTGEAG